MLEDVLAFAALPLAAAVIFTGIHTWLGLQVLRRNVVFADLALAQVSALGATVAVVAGHAVQSAAGYAYTVLFTAIGAVLLTASRGLARSVRQEAFIGVLYVAATAATVLVVDRSPQGAEHVKKMLVGGILSVTADEVLTCVLLYAAIGTLHWLVRRPLLAAADNAGAAMPDRKTVGRHEAPDCSGDWTSGGHNILGTKTGCTWTDGPGDMFGVDPKLAPLADNGGATLTHALVKGSPAINAADPVFAPPFDQRGLERNPDIGAYELVQCGKAVVNIVGSEGKDKLKGTKGADGMFGLGGKDTLIGKGGKDGLCGGFGKDTLKGGGGKDFLKGQNQKDTCIGGGGRDVTRTCEKEKKI